MPIKSAGGGATTLAGLTDTNIVSPANGDILQFIGTKWSNIPSSSDWLTQYLLLAGRTGGQIIGTNAHASGAIYDIAIEGRLMLGDNLGTSAFTAGRFLNVAQLCRNATSQMVITYFGSGFTGTATGTWRGLQLTVSGAVGYSGGVLGTAQGFFFTNTLNMGAIAATNLIGGVFQSTPSEGALAVATGIANVYGLQAQALGTTTPNTLHVGTKLTGMYVEFSVRNKPFVTVYGYEIFGNSTWGAQITDLIFFGINPGGIYGNTVGVTNTYGLKLDLGVTGTANFVKRYGLWVDDWFDRNILAQSTTIGLMQDPIHTLDLQGNLGLTVSGVKAAAYVPALETVIPCNAAGGAFAINLPTAVGIKGRVYIIKKVDATGNAVNVTPNGAETIDGAAPYVLNVQWQVVRIISDGANWLVI